MDQQVQRDVRSAITMAYGLMQHTRVQHRERMAKALGVLEERLRIIETGLGGPSRNALGPVDLGAELAEVEALVREAEPPLGDQMAALVRSVRHLQRRISHLASRQIPSRPLFGALPLKRIIPQDVHSVMDYGSALTAAAGGLLASSPEAKAASAALAGAGIATSAITDYRLSAKKIIPIEAHEVIDYIWGASAIAAPFVLGYYRKDRVATAMHVVTGVMTIASALFTDYRAAVGVGRRRLER